MKLLLDHDVPEDLTYLLRELGHEVVCLRDVIESESADSLVLRFAREHGCVLLTCNRDDFIELEHDPHYGIVVIIRRRSRAAERAALFRLLGRAGETGLKGNINFA